MRLLKDKNICLYLIYQFLFGLYPIIPIMSLYFLAKNLSFGDIGILFAVFSLSGFLAEIPTGYIGDKYGRKYSVMIGLSILAVTAYIWTVLTTTFMFAIFTSIWMIGLAFISGSFEGYIFDYLKSKKLENLYDKVLSISGTVMYFAGALGSIVGAYLFSINIYYPYYLLAFLFSVCIGIVTFMDKDAVIEEAEFNEQLKIFSGIKYIYQTKTVLWLALYVSLLFGFFSYFRGSVDKPYILELGLFDVKWLGVFVAVSMLIQSAFMSQFAKIKARLGENRLLLLYWVASSLPLLGMALGHGLFALVAVTLYYTTESFQEALINSFSQKHIPSKIRATTLSSIKVYLNIGGAILGLSAGYMFNIISIRTGLQISFIYTLVIAVIFLIYKHTTKISFT
jgi:MFS family permease